METSFHTRSFIHFSPIWTGPVLTEGSAESVIPDNMPDINSVLDCSALLFIRSKECESGRINLSVDVNAQLIYLSDDTSEIQSIPIRSSTTVTVSVSEADSDCLCCAHLQLQSIDCKIINSRKISLHTEIGGDVFCFRREERIIPTSVKDSEYTIETLYGSASMWLVSDVREKSFVVSDDYELPALCAEASSVLSQRISCRVDEIEFVGDKMVFRGRIQSFLLIQNPNKICPCSYESSFSQIMEINAEEESAPEIRLMLTGAYFDLPEHGEKKINAEIHVLAQVLCRCKYTADYIADAYSNQKPIQPDFEELPVCSGRRSIKHRYNTAKSMENDRDVSDILYSYGYITSTTIDKGAVQLSLSVKILYMRKDGIPASLTARWLENFDAEINTNEMLYLQSAICEAPYISCTADKLDIQMPIELKLFAEELQNIRIVNHFQFVDARDECPSVTLLMCNSKEELWLLAKNHQSSVDAILAANGGRSEGLLLIPKCR